MKNSEFNAIINNRIKTLRKKKRLTIEQLAYQSGISKGGLSEIERNKKEPRAYTIFKLCYALDIEMKEFFDINELKNIEID